MEQISDADRSQQVYGTITAFGWSVVWNSLKPVPDDAWPMDIIARALTAARIEGERQGLERAIERLEKRAEDSITHSAEQQIRWDIKALYDLITELTP